MTIRTLTSFRLSLCALALCSTAAFAELPYNYVDLDFVSVDAGGGSDSGVSLDGSFVFTDMFYGVATFADIGNSTQFSAGAGLHGGLGENLDIFGELQFLSVDGGGGSETGYVISGGLRGEVTPSLELFGRIDHADVGFGGDDSFTLGGVYYFDKIGVGAAFTSNDNVDALAIGVRFTF